MATITVVNTNDSGAGSLRNAVAMANPGDTIIFAVSGIITLLSPIDINKSLTINGPAIISGSTTRIFNISGATTIVTLNNLTLENGIDNSGAGGGAILNDAATLNVVRCTFSNNRSDSSGNASGGAIANRNGGTVNITNNSQFISNSSNFGGAVGNFPLSTVNITNSSFSNNRATTGNGGAVSNDGIVNITGGMFSQNSAAGDGGAVANDRTAVITNSTFLGFGRVDSTLVNSASNGGAITNFGSGTVDITNSVFSNNNVSGVGGAIVNRDLGQVDITNSTFTANTANFGGL